MLIIHFQKNKLLKIYYKKQVLKKSSGNIQETNIEDILSQFKIYCNGEKFKLEF